MVENLTKDEKNLIESFLDICRKKRIMNKLSQNYIEKNILSSLYFIEYTPLRIAEIRGIIKLKYKKTK
jgi:hypothetical protein